MDADDLQKMTAEELRVFAVERGIRWQDKNGKSLRKADLLDVVEHELKQLEQIEEPSAAGRLDDTAEVVLPRVQDKPEPATEQAPPWVAPTLTPGAEAAPAARPTGRFRVTKDCRYVIQGVAYQLKRGAIVQDDTHAMDDIRAQNVPLEPVTHEDPQPGDEVSHRIDFDYGPPVVGVRQYVPIGETTVINRSPEEAQYVDVMPDGTRVPVPGTPVAKRTEIEAKVKR